MSVDESPEFDVFISHASEDKPEVVGPLVSSLRERGLRVWIDEHELTIGDSLGRAIDRGLSKSRFGVAILSHSFFAKEWPQRELEGLASREIASGKKAILPVWHELSFEELSSLSPMLASRLGVSTGEGLDRVADEIQRAVERTSTDDRARRLAFQEGWWSQRPELMVRFVVRGLEDGDTDYDPSYRIGGSIELAETWGELYALFAARMSEDAQTPASLSEHFSKSYRARYVTPIIGLVRESEPSASEIVDHTWPRIRLEDLALSSILGTFRDRGLMLAFNEASGQVHWVLTPAGKNTFEGMPGE